MVKAEEASGRSQAEIGVVKVEEASQASDLDESGEETASEAEGGPDLFLGRVRAVVAALVERGLIQAVGAGGDKDAAAVRYSRVPPVPVVLEGPENARPTRKQRAMDGGDTFGILAPDSVVTQSQAQLEDEFAKFFGDIVS